MTTQYLPFPSAAAALAQSNADWAQKILGHPTANNAVTKNLWKWITNPNDGTAYGVFDDNVMSILTPKLTAGQLNALNAALIPASDPRIVATLAALQTRPR